MSSPWHKQPDWAESLEDVSPLLPFNPVLNLFDLSGNAIDWCGYVNSDGGFDPAEVNASEARIQKHAADIQKYGAEIDSTPKLLWYMRRSGNWVRIGIPRSVWTEVLSPLVRAGESGWVFSGGRPDGLTANHQTCCARLRRLGLIISAGPAPDRNEDGGSLTGFRYTLHSMILEDLPLDADLYPTESLLLQAIEMAPEFEKFKLGVIQKRASHAALTLKTALERLLRRAPNSEPTEETASSVGE
jgi:hypothetical protein